MKKVCKKEDLSEFYKRKGQEFLDGFKKLPYNTDRIGQSFVMKTGLRTSNVPSSDSNDNK
jgi:hypothetical protein